MPEDWDLEPEPEVEEDALYVAARISHGYMFWSPDSPTEVPADEQVAMKADCASCALEPQPDAMAP